LALVITLLSLLARVTLVTIGLHILLSHSGLNVTVLQEALHDAGVQMPFPTQNVNLQVEPQTVVRLSQASWTRVARKSASENCTTRELVAGVIPPP
jgi:hypothetical protein